MALLALAPSAVALAPITAGIAVIGPVLAVVAQTRRARLIPRHLLGRIYSVNLLISGGTAPLGSLLAGFLLSGLGAPANCAVLGSGLLTIAAATASPTHPDVFSTLPPTPSPQWTPQRCIPLRRRQLGLGYSRASVSAAIMSVRRSRWTVRFGSRRHR